MTLGLRLPDAVINPAAGGTGTQQATVAAENLVLPIVYGRQRLGGRIFAVGTLGSDLVIGAAWCLGQIEAVESITLNDAAVPTSVTVTTYTGTTSQGIDPTLADALAGYADTLTGTFAGVPYGVAYSVFRVPPGAVTGFPRVEAIVQGRRLYDPRTTSTSYSRNPALALGDWLSNSVYGQGLTVDWTSVGTVATACDATLSDSSKRRELDLAIDTVLPAAQWADVLRTYAGCVIVHDGASVALVADRPVGSYARALDAGDIVAGSLDLRRLSTRQRPTVVRVAYTDTSATPWRTAEVSAKASGVDAGTTVRREETVALPGITRRAQAYREAVERLNAVMLTDLNASWTTFDEGLADLVGDVVTLTHGVGLTAQPFRVTDVQLESPGRWRVQAASYDAAVYSDSISPPSGGAYTSLADPSVIPAISGLTCDSGSDHLLLGTDGSIVSRIYVTWTGTTYPYLLHYEVQFKRAADTYWQTITSPDADTYCAPVEDGSSYTVRARIVNGFGLTGDWASVTHTVIGKSAAPPAPTNFLVDVYGDGTRRYQWTEPTNMPVDFAGYKIRYGLGTGLSWASLTALHTGLLYGSPYESNMLAAGTYTFGLATRDTSGNWSDPIYCEATLPDPRLSNALEFVDAAQLGWPGTKTNGWVDPLTGWLVATDSKTWASLATDGITWDTWTSWARDANDLTYTHSTIDLGAIVTFTPLVSVVAPAGTLTVEVRTSDNGSTWTSWAAAAGAVTARYIEARAQVTGSAGDDLRFEGFVILLDAETIVEELQDIATSGLTGSYRIGTGDIRLPIAETYTTIRSVMLALQNVGAGWSWELIDKDTSVGPRVKIYNSSNAAADATIDALVRGI